MSLGPAAATRNTAILLVSVATVAIAFKGIFARFAYIDGATVTELLLLRFLIASPAFLLIAQLTAPRAATAESAGWRAYLLAGALFFAATLSDFTAIERVGAALSRIILFTYPVWVILLSALRARRAPPRRQVVVFTAVYAGLLLVVLPGGQATAAPGAWTGIAWGLASAVTYAGFLVTSQHVMTTVGSARFTARYNVVVLLLMVAYAGIADWPQHLPTSSTVVWGSLIAIVCTVVPFMLLFEGIRRIGAADASLISLSGPAITVTAAWLLLDEALAPIQCAGLAVVVAGMWLLYRPARPSSGTTE
jgi:drug/metabolite transporter (DMT)-like permease